MVTIKDVARKAGVSVTTVSRALNHHGDVAEATRAHIAGVAKELNYHPNVMARSLQNSRANAVGLLVPLVLHRAHDPFWFDFIGGMAAGTAERGVDLLLSATEVGSESDRPFRRLLHGGRVDGLLICDVRRGDQRIDVLGQQGMPFVAFGRTLGNEPYSFIDVDGEAGVRDAVNHLISLGHQRIMYLGVNRDFGFSHFRLAGYRKALLQAGLPVDERLVHEDMTEESCRRVTRGLLTHPDPPTAVFVGADYLASIVMKTVRELGLSVPGDVSLAVFDDSAIIQHADPPLTAVSQPNRRLGEEAAELLVDRVSNPDLPLIQRLIVPSLIVRESTAPPRESAVRKTG